MKQCKQEMRPRAPQNSFLLSKLNRIQHISDRIECIKQGFYNVVECLGNLKNDLNVIENKFNQKGRLEDHELQEMFFLESKIKKLNSFLITKNPIAKIDELHNRKAMLVDKLIISTEKSLTVNCSLD